MNDLRSPGFGRSYVGLFRGRFAWTFLLQMTLFAGTVAGISAVLLLCGCEPGAPGGAAPVGGGEDGNRAGDGELEDDGEASGATDDDGNGTAEGNDNEDGSDGAPAEGLAAGLVEVPDPLSGDNPVYGLEAADVPAPGESVTDSRLGTAQIRATQAEQLRHEYSRYDAFNADQSMIILHDVMEGDFLVYRTGTVPYDDEANLVTTLDIEEPRWDPVDPDVVWGIDEFRLLTIGVAAAETILIKDFASDATIGPVLGANPDLYRITRHFEGESSRDKRYWVFALQGTNDDYRDRYLFTWDRERDEVLGLYELAAGESLIDWVGMSPLGTWVVIGGDFDNGGGIGPGLRIVNQEFTSPFHQLAHATAHADVGLDSDGNEVIVMQNTETDRVELFPLEPDAEPIPLINLFYSAESPIGFNCGIHVSCNAPGYCVVSTEVEAGVPEQNWLDRTITLIQLDRDEPRLFHLAKVYGSTGAYWEETQATITNDGSRVIWATNWNRNVGDERVWVMELGLPIRESGALTIRH